MQKSVKLFKRLHHGHCAFGFALEKSIVPQKNSQRVEPACGDEVEFLFNLFQVAALNKSLPRRIARVIIHAPHIKRLCPDDNLIATYVGKGVASCSSISC